ncbi:general secretion pathway protein C [Melaminivora suipulveris]|uniref:General secretion pathway protein C n=1 Tax=Melaminivora suipulveris TaxID=2109913 RepID=A0A2R3QA63_9BURK|nr:type II secretion system protein N [Melaminivora suipulveris]AVO48682.1 general secretion pathway protein C [Melaminivora suipulveris]
MAKPASSGLWPVRLATLALWALAGAGAVYWALALAAPARGPAPVAPAPALRIDTQAVARVLGAGAQPLQAAVPSGPARLVLHGVLAGSRSGGGAALISIDGQPARPYRLGAALEPGLVVQSLSRREVRLGSAMGAASTVTLSMPDDKPGASGG